MKGRVLKGFNLFVDGRGYLGEVMELTPGNLSLILEDFRPGGFDMALPVDYGMEPIEVNFTLSHWHPEIVALFGQYGNTRTAITFKGAYQLANGGSADVQPVNIYVRGIISAVEPENWVAGQNAPIAYTARASYYRLNIGGQDVLEVDIENARRVVNGVDQLEAMRNAIGA
jgi:P2 family phage contractile tail tube protein